MMCFALATCLAAGPAPVLNGIDVLEKEGFALLKGRSVGLITNHTGVTLDGRATADVLAKAPGVRLVAFFAPEHGIRGEKDERIVDGVDEKTGLPVYSLYNPGQKDAGYRPKASQLEGIDTLVFDIQDVGARFYTYIGTLGYAMEEAAKRGIRFVVLDRPNPIRGLTVAGPVADKDKLGFTAYHPIPVQHGMTVGEMATLYNLDRKLGCDLTVVRMEGWRRDMWFDETGQRWINPSPNMRNPTQALLYPGICLLEACNVSVGRGTDTPFEWIGAPYIDGLKLAASMNAKGLKGIRFYARNHTPSSSKFAGEPCGGVAFIVTDRDKLDSVRVGCELAYELRRSYPQFEWQKVNNLLANSAALETLMDSGYEAALKEWTPALNAFKAKRKKCLLY